MSTILITGGTGLIGTALTGLLLEKGHHVIILSRSAAAGGLPATLSPGTVSKVHWDPPSGTIDADAIRQADFIVHLAGAGVADKRWSAKRKTEIEESRTKSGALLVKALTGTPNKVKAVISTSG